MSSGTPPARITACSAAATNDRSRGCSRSSEVWLTNTRRTGPSTQLTLPLSHRAREPLRPRQGAVEHAKSLAGAPRLVASFLRPAGPAGQVAADAMGLPVLGT